MLLPEREKVQEMLRCFPVKVDIVFPASSRPEYTGASLRALAANTDWSLVRSIVVYTDGASFSFDGLIARELARVVPLEYDHNHYGGPVAIMNHWIQRAPAEAEVMAKIDNDVIVPPGWLNACVAVMEAHADLDILGIEPPMSRTPAPWSPDRERGSVPPERIHMVAGRPEGYARTHAIGGIGLMRRRAFTGREQMKPFATYGGFTDWQERNHDVVKGWIVPPLNVFLLDRLPFEPWCSLGKEYIRRGEQRPWTMYRAGDSALWDWWLR